MRRSTLKLTSSKEFPLHVLASIGMALGRRFEEVGDVPPAVADAWNQAVDDGWFDRCDNVRGRARIFVLYLMADDALRARDDNRWGFPRAGGQ